LRLPLGLGVGVRVGWPKTSWRCCGWMVDKLDVITGPFAYVRLLGDRKAVDDLT
jgi:hypothetical protein